MMIIGIVGKPSCGKSTFFKAATLAEVDIANYPFTTIKPNHGTGYVKVDCADKFFKKQCNPRFGYCMDHNRFVPVDLLDVAGLVPGAHEGKGMGNQFLDDLRQADVLIHVIDVSGSTNAEGEPVNPGSYDPAHDIEFLEVELDMWYVGILRKGWERFARQIQQEKQQVHKALAKQLSAFGVTEKMVESTIKSMDLDPEKVTGWKDDELRALATELRRLTKRMIIACNKIDVQGAADNFERLKKQFPNHMLIPCSAESELALREAAKKGMIKYIPGEGRLKIIDDSGLNDAQKNALRFIEDSVMERFGGTGVQNTLDAAVFDLLRYIAIYPGGVNKLEDSEGRVLPDCFLMPPDTTALDFAFRLHTDFGKNFIRAIDVKTRMTVGKEHELKNGDVIEIVSGR